MTMFLHDDDDATAMAIEIPQVFSKNRQAYKKVDIQIDQDILTQDDDGLTLYQTTNLKTTVQLESICRRHFKCSSNHDLC